MTKDRAREITQAIKTLINEMVHDATTDGDSTAGMSVYYAEDNLIATLENELE